MNESLDRLAQGLEAKLIKPEPVSLRLNDPIIEIDNKTTTKIINTETPIHVSIISQTTTILTTIAITSRQSEITITFNKHQIHLIRTKPTITPHRIRTTNANHIKTDNNGKIRTPTSTPINAKTHNIAVKMTKIRINNDKQTHYETNK